MGIVFEASKCSSVCRNCSWTVGSESLVLLFVHCTLLLRELREPMDIRQRAQGQFHFNAIPVTLSLSLAPAEFPFVGMQSVGQLCCKLHFHWFHLKNVAINVPGL